mmetsp:Transcript_4949/g.12409  ORF Transcript_4949/g.12409 Transcript_4949/m.12409 type:complete len:556 (-) Transcript_4949:482-2149(-)
MKTETAPAAFVFISVICSCLETRLEAALRFATSLHRDYCFAPQLSRALASVLRSLKQRHFPKSTGAAEPPTSTHCHHRWRTPSAAAATAEVRVHSLASITSTLTAFNISPLTTFHLPAAEFSTIFPLKTVLSAVFPPLLSSWQQRRVVQGHWVHGLVPHRASRRRQRISLVRLLFRLRLLLVLPPRPGGRLLLPPLDSERVALDLQVFVQLVGRRLSALTGLVNYERAGLLGNHLDHPQLAVHVENVAEVLLGERRVDASDVEGGDGFVVGWLQGELLLRLAHDFCRQWIVRAVKAVADVLLRQFAGRGHLVPKRTLVAAIACTFHEEAAYSGFVSLVVGVFSGQLHEHGVFLLAVGQLAGLDFRGLLVYVVLTVHYAVGHLDLVLLGEVVVSHGDRQTVLQVEEAGLAAVLQPRARLADDGGFVPRVAARFPAEQGEGPRADLTLDPVVLLRHAREGVRPQTGLAQHGEVRTLPPLLVHVSLNHHLLRFLERRLTPIHRARRGRPARLRVRANLEVVGSGSRSRHLFRGSCSSSWFFDLLSRPGPTEDVARFKT